MYNFGATNLTQNIFILALVMIVMISLKYTTNILEKFQFIIPNKQVDKIIPINMIDKKELMFNVRSQNFEECKKLCYDAPRCDGFNYFLNECDLYKNIVHGY